MRAARFIAAGDSQRVRAQSNPVVIPTPPLAFACGCQGFPSCGARITAKGMRKQEWQWPPLPHDVSSDN